MRFFDREWKLEPQTAAEAEAVKTPQDMRKRLRQYARHNALARRAADLAYREGWSGEDEMTVLAYSALLQLEAMVDREMHALRTQVSVGAVPWTTPPKDVVR